MSFRYVMREGEQESGILYSDQLLVWFGWSRMNQIHKPNPHYVPPQGIHWIPRGSVLWWRWHDPEDREICEYGELEDTSQRKLFL